MNQRHSNRYKFSTIQRFLTKTKLLMQILQIMFQSKSETSHLLDHKAQPKPVHEQLFWQLIHFIGFFVGGTTFIAGSSLYYYPDYSSGALIAAWLYIIGSVGFLSVDVLEFFTFTDEFWLRTNISMSAIGSTLYVLGSIGFLPVIFNQSQSLGVWGFILGSFFIGVSQAWKVARIGSLEDELGKPGNRRFRVYNLVSDFDIFSQVGVEADAGLGAWCFFVGTIMFQQNYDFNTVIGIWVVGSIFFTIGSLFLGYRHFVMGV